MEIVEEESESEVVAEAPGPMSNMTGLVICKSQLNARGSGLPTPPPLSGGGGMATGEACPGGLFPKGKGAQRARLPRPSLPLVPAFVCARFLSTFEFSSLGVKHYKDVNSAAQRA